jgi:hypothetical protein
MLHRITFVVVAAVALAAAAVAYSASGSGSAPRTIKATLIYTGLTPVDSDHNEKPSIGDVSVVPGLFVDAAGKRMGRVYASCMQVNAGGTEYNCTDYVHFTGGDILTAGRFSPLEKTSRSAIVGGTGVYAGARGTFIVKWLKRDFSKAAVAFTLQP